MRENHFTRPTIAAALVLLERTKTQASFGILAFRLGLDEKIPSDTAISVGKKIVLLSREISQFGERIVPTLDGQVTLTEALVREAVAMTQGTSLPSEEQERFLRALALDGFVVEWVEEGTGKRALLRAALPSELDLPATDDEVHQLLNDFNFVVARGHLDQAIEAHTRGDWAAANSQTRTFIESLFDAIAHDIDSARAVAVRTSENRRQMLADMKFLSVQRHEWTPDGKNFINGLFKMLHTEGSHPGLSDEDHSTFRLHLALVTARTFLRRLRNNG